MDIQERIISEAGILFGKYGIRSVTMDSLAEDMGISKRTIYENFKDKDTLLLEVISYYKTQQLKEMNKVISDSENIVSALFSILSKMINRMKAINPSFFHDLKRYHSPILEQLQGNVDLRDHSLTRKILTEGLEQEIFRSEINIEIVNQTLHELFNLFGADSKLTAEGYHRGELFNNIIIPYLKGISTEKGRVLIEKMENFDYENVRSESHTLD